MTEFLVHRFIPDFQNTASTIVRQAYGRLSSLVGIIANLLLFAGKFTVGTLFHSVSITADGVNNLSDAGSSIISLVSFHLSGKPADPEHPFGHERYEYISSMVIAVLIFILGAELGRSSLEKILHPEMPSFNLLTAAVLLCSIAVKLWLYRFNTSLGKKIDSSILAATAADSLSDVMATSAVLISAIISPLIHYSLDGWMGAVVALLILRAGWGILREALDKLLGESPSADFVEKIRSFILQYDGVLGLHDLMIHSYGPNRVFASAHVEVSASANVLDSHDMIDNIERDILREMGLHLVIHMDPVDVSNPLVNSTREKVSELVAQMAPGLSIHDFRMVVGESHSNLIFDVLVPYDCAVPTHELAEKIQNAVRQNIDPNYFTVPTFDRSFVESSHP